LRFSKGKGDLLCHHQPFEADTRGVFLIGFWMGEEPLVKLRTLWELQCLTLLWPCAISGKQEKYNVMMVLPFEAQYIV
jgi:hypothetical protein